MGIFLFRSSRPAKLWSTVWILSGTLLEPAYFFFYIVHFFANHLDSLVFDIVYKFYYLFLNLEDWFSFRINVNFITLVYDHFISISWPRQWCVILARWIFVFILLKRFAIVIVSIANTCLPYKGQVELIRAWEVFSQLLKECLWTLQIINYILNGFLIHYYA